MKKSISHLSQKVASRIWLVLIDLFGLITVYEEAAVHHVWGLHTISYWAAKKRWLGYLILLGIIGLGAFWFWHFHQNIVW